MYFEGLAALLVDGGLWLDLRFSQWRVAVGGCKVISSWLEAGLHWTLRYK